MCSLCVCFLFCVRYVYSPARLARTFFSCLSHVVQIYQIDHIDHDLDQIDHDLDQIDHDLDRTDQIDHDLDYLDPNLPL